MDTFTTLWNRLLNRCPAVGPLLSQDLIRDSFNQLAERRMWSWLMKPGCFFPAIFYNTGTADVTPALFTVTGTGTGWDASMIGQQIRIGGTGSSYPTYTITQVPSSTSLVLDQPWVGPALTLQAYQIFQCYFPVPSDFNYFYSLTNPTSNYRLWTNITQAELDMADAQRVTSGPSYGCAFYDYTKTFLGTIDPVLQVHGAGASPVSTTSYGYSFPANSIYTIEILTGGVVGVADFVWKQNSGNSTLATTSSDAIDLSNGVQVYFPAGLYNSGDIFVINCTAGTVSGVPRYELWPRPINTPYVYPYIYVRRKPELTDAQPQLPEFIADRGDVILEMALAACARWPGGSPDSPNPGYDLALAVQHEARAERMISGLEIKDDDVAIKNLSYQQMAFAAVPWQDGAYLQSHAWPLPSWS